SLIELIVNRRVVTYGSLLLFLLATFGAGSLVPSGFIPNEDQGILYANVLSPPGATVERTQEVVDEVQEIANSLNAVESVSTLAGTNLFSDGTGAPYGTVLINLKDWNERDVTVDEVADVLREQTRHIKAANIDFIPPPAVPGYG